VRGTPGLSVSTTLENYKGARPKGRSATGAKCGRRPGRSRPPWSASGPGLHKSPRTPCCRRTPKAPARKGGARPAQPPPQRRRRVTRAPRGAERSACAPETVQASGPAQRNPEARFEGAPPASTRPRSEAARAHLRREDGRRSGARAARQGGRRPAEGRTQRPSHRRPRIVMTSTTAPGENHRMFHVEHSLQPHPECSTWNTPEPPSAGSTRSTWNMSEG
jgi:hypothetical protein